jgi:protein TonB
MPPKPRSEETSDLSDGQNTATANPATANSAIPDAAIPSDSTPAVDVPEITASSASPADLGKALSSSPAMPKLGTPISQGVAGGTLAYKVQPIYPPEARRLHLEGTVVFDATITERGQIDNLKLVSGDPILARAATDAVSKWRYAPYLLNGKPISKQTRINIRFIAP